VDFGRELARRWLGSPQAVRFLQVRSDTAIEHLQASNVDLVIAALSHRQDLEAGADFSLPYFVDGQAILIRGDDAGVITGLDGLNGRPVGVVAWGGAADALPAAVPFTLTLQSYDRFDAAVAALGRGDVDAVADERRRLFWGAQMLPSVAMLGQYTSVPVALAFRENDPQFADLVNLTLQEIVSDGTFMTLYERWFAPDQPPTVEIWPGQEIASLADAPTVGQVPDTINAIRARGRLRVAMTDGRSPFAYLDETGVPAGYEVNLARLLAEQWLGDPTAVDFVPAPLEMGRQSLRTGQVDILIGGLTHTRAAELEMDFSLTTYVGGEGLMTLAGGVPVTGLLSLHGQQVAVVDGSPSREVLMAASQNAGISLAVLSQPTLEAAIGLLGQGQVAAVAGERSVLLGSAYATPGLGLLPLRLSRLPLALGLPPGDSAFRDLVNLTLQAMKAGGQLDGLYGAWFADGPLPLEVWPGAPYRSLRLEVTPPEPSAQG
jgi:polar amino acid transport system substrate-binding protein